MQNRRTLIAAVPAPALCGVARAAPPAITVLEGMVDERSAQKFFAAVANRADSIIGLKALLDPIGRLVAEADDKRLITYLSGSSRETGEKYQLSFAGGFARDKSLYRLDGFYLVKYAGMGQGILAFSLEPVKESEVLLSGARLERVKLR